MGGVKLFLKCRYKEILVGLELRLDQCKHKPMGLGLVMGGWLAPTLRWTREELEGGFARRASYPLHIHLVTCGPDG